MSSCFFHCEGEGVAIIYVLLKLALSFVMGTSMPSPEELSSPASTPEPSLAMFVITVILLGFLIWAFRLLWIYVPVALNISVGEYTRRFSAFKDSFPLMGVWLFCFVPSGLVLVMVLSLVQAVFPVVEGAANYPHHAANSIVQAVIDTAMVVLASLGIAFGIHDAMAEDQKS